MRPTEPRAPTTRAGGPARSAVRVTACAGASGIGTIPLGVRSDGNVRACRRCGVDVTDRSSYVRRPVVSTRTPGTRTAARARRTTQIRRRPRGARTRYRGGREASTGGSSTLAARHPLVTRSQPRRAIKRKPGRPHPDPRRTTDPVALKCRPPGHPGRPPPSGDVPATRMKRESC